MFCPGFFRLENLWKKGVMFFDVNLLNFLPKKIMLVSVKIYGKKEVPLPKKGQNTKMTSWKVIAQVVLVFMNMAINFLAPRVGYFAHMDLKQKWNVLKPMPTSRVAINVRFLGVIDPKSN